MAGEGPGPESPPCTPKVIQQPPGERLDPQQPQEPPDPHSMAKQEAPAPPQAAATKGTGGLINA